MKLFAAIAIGLALVSSAHAAPLKVGDVIDFKTPEMAFCRNYNDAQEVTRLETLRQWYNLQAFLNLHRAPDLSGASNVQAQQLMSRWCTHVDVDPSDYEIVDVARTQYTGPNDGFYCLWSRVNWDVGPQPAHPVEPTIEEKQKRCMWLFLEGKH